MQPQPLVLDTNIVLDAFVFADEAARSLVPALAEKRLQWLATQAMRDELERVLGYRHIASRLVQGGAKPGDVLERFDRHARLLEPPVKAAVTCRDPDDQKFIDLAVACRAWLLSRDKAVLSMKKRLAKLSVITQSAIEKIANA